MASLLLDTGALASNIRIGTINWLLVAVDWCVSADGGMDMLVN